MHLFLHLLGHKALKGLPAPHVFLALAAIAAATGQPSTYLFCALALAFALGWRDAPRSQAIVWALGALALGAVVSCLRAGALTPLSAAPAAAFGAAILATIGHGVGRTFALARAGAAAREAAAGPPANQAAWAVPTPQRGPASPSPKPKPKPRPARGAGAIDRALASRTPTVSPRKRSIFS